jgi:hypothetical protein
VLDPAAGDRLAAVILEADLDLDIKTNPQGKG